MNPTANPIASLHRFALLACLLSATIATAASPEISYVKPLGVSLGETTTIRFFGPRLDDVHQVLVGDDRLIVEKIEVVKGGVDVTFQCDRTLPCGTVAVQLISKTGLSNIRLISVGQFPVIEEIEPNGATDSPQPLTTPCTVEGIVDREDVDRFAVELTAGQTCKFEIEAIRLQFSLINQRIFDPVVRIVDAAGFEVVSSDDNTLLRQDSLCAFTAPADGTYIVSVHESSFGGDKAMGGYRLHVGDFPRPVTVHPAAGTVGETMQAMLTDIDGTTKTVTLTLPSEPAASYEVHDKADDVSSPSPNVVRVEPHPVLVELPGGVGLPPEQSAAAPVTFCGIIEPGQSDNFYVDCSKNQTLWVTVFAREPFRSPLDGVLSVIGPDKKGVKSSDDSSGRLDPSLEFTAAADGVYRIVLRDHLRGGSPRHNYAIAVTERKPTLSIEAKELDRDRAATLAVPAGGHHAMVIRATRFLFNDPVALALEGLPQGVTATTWPLPPSWGEIPVLLSADPQTPLSGQMIGVTASVADKAELNTSLTQHHKLVLGRNRREMIGQDLPGVALAVTEATPFDVVIDQPKMPAIRLGSRSLTARVVRHEGFEGEIRLRSPVVPPGVAINNAKKFGAKEDWVEIPMTANSKAAVGTWPIILLARYNTPLGSREVATAAINLTVEESIVGVKFGAATATIGQAAIIPVELKKLRDFDGIVTVSLAGLPRGVNGGQPRRITLEDQTVNFDVQLDDTAQPGLQKTVVLQTIVTRDGETVTQTNGGGTIRINPPPPEPKDSPPQTGAKPAAPKPLNRLEQLRQQKERAQ